LKSFLGTLLICLVCCFTLLFFFGQFLLSNIWAATAAFALFLAILIHCYMEQGDEIDALKKRLDALEGKEIQEETPEA